MSALSVDIQFATKLLQNHLFDGNSCDIIHFQYVHLIVLVSQLRAQF